MVTFENSQKSSLSATTRPDQKLARATQSMDSITEIRLSSSPQNTAPVSHPNLMIRKGDIALKILNSVSDRLLSQIGEILDAE